MMVFKFGVEVEDECFHNLVEFRFKDLHDNEYYQLLYLYFDKESSSIMPLSKVYEGKSIKDREDKIE